MPLRLSLRFAAALAGAPAHAAVARGGLVDVVVHLLVGLLLAAAGQGAACCLAPVLVGASRLAVCPVVGDRHLLHRALAARVVDRLALVAPECSVGCGVGCVVMV